MLIASAVQTGQNALGFHYIDSAYVHRDPFFPFVLRKLLRLVLDQTISNRECQRLPVSRPRW